MMHRWLMTSSETHPNLLSSDGLEASRILEAARALKEDRLREFARQAISSGAPVLSLPLANLLYVKLVDWEMNKHEARGQDLHIGHIPVIIIAVACHCIVLTWERQPGGAFRTAVHTTTLINTMVTVLAYKSASQMLFDRVYVFMARAGGAIIFGNVKATCLLNCMLSIAASARWYNFHVVDPTVHELFGSDCFVWFCVQELLLICGICTIAIALDTQTGREAKATMEARASRSFLKAVSMLLNTTYSVVIHLDENFRILGESADFGALLLHGPDRSLNGSLLQDYAFDEEDKGHLQQHLDDQPVEETLQSVALPLRFRLRDSSGSPLHVEMLHSRFKDIDHRSHHLLGIREIEVDNFPQVEADVHSASRAEIVQPHSCAHNKKGTPPELVREALPEQAAPRTVVPGPSLMSMASEMTSIETRAKTMAMFLLHWNIEKRASFCCSWHALTSEAMSVLRKINRRPCYQVEDLLGNQQCQSCGMLAGVGSGASAEGGNVTCCHWCGVQRPSLTQSPMQQVSL
eukprot:TRINITY_DN7311_c0_g1_i3.p1 TRINITY_DN7311_c0_g1~~TRINITY_DN7311_c0_g1_i3.p1  ORF type:complete len:593 (-),score=83.14 TRINITY_DN7311_c0_g1_i3:312-1871(-)